MIDALKITNFKASYEELEEHIIFWILAAGKNGVTTANALDALLTNWCFALGDSPFEIVGMKTPTNSNRELAGHK